MEGHSGQVFVCSVCSHASRSRDALRKHFVSLHVFHLNTSFYLFLLILELF